MIKPVFEISSNSDGKVIAKDLTVYKDESSSSISLGDFKFSETSVLYSPIKRKNQNDCTMTFYTSRIGDIFNVFGDNKDKMTVNIEKDGAYRLFFIILPNEEWYNDNFSNNINIINSYINRDGKLYYTDGYSIFSVTSEKESDDNLIYRKDIINIKDVLEDINTNNILSAFMISKDIVSVNNLIDCYLSLCKKILDCSIISCCSKGMNGNEELIFKRDMVWMALNAIEILASKCEGIDECPELDEIDSIIERIGGCNGLCVNNGFDIHNYRSVCGCIK